MTISIHTEGAKPLDPKLPAMSDPLLEFGRRLRTYRDRRGLTQPELARAIGVHAVTIAKWEGGSQEPSGSNLVALCAVLRVSPNVLMGRPRASTEEAIAAYRASPYHATLEAEGRPLSDDETDDLRYLLDSFWLDGAKNPKTLHSLLRLIRETPDLLASDQK